MAKHKYSVAYFQGTFSHHPTAKIYNGVGEEIASFRTDNSLGQAAFRAATEDIISNGNTLFHDDRCIAGTIGEILGVV